MCITMNCTARNATNLRIWEELERRHARLSKSHSVRQWGKHFFLLKVEIKNCKTFFFFLKLLVQNSCTDTFFLQISSPMATYMFRLQPAVWHPSFWLFLVRHPSKSNSPTATSNLYTFFFFFLLYGTCVLQKLAKEQ